MENVKLDEGFVQVVIWPATLVEPSNSTAFESWAETEFGVTVQYLEEIRTLPDETGPGGRNDVFFAIASGDIAKFAVPRLAYGMRWIEDAVSEVNGGNVLYPERVMGYCSWDA